MREVMIPEPSHSPFLISGPALISFSGGRTSGYMLKRILLAHGGQLPPDVHVQFSNTGKEREETLRFVHDCETHFGVKVHWLEWRDGKPGFEEVGYNSASRAGEPFAALIEKRRYLPNAVTRFCSVVLKVRTAGFYARSLGWKHWINVVGLRHDEGARCLKAYARNDSGKEPFKAYLPLDKARITKRDVMKFWAEQPFDLQLLPHEGNCDLCFLKGYGKLREIIRDVPARADWWIAQEAAVSGVTAKRSGEQFVTEHSYADVLRHAHDQTEMVLDDDDYDAECGLSCGGFADA